MPKICVEFANSQWKTLRKRTSFYPLSTVSDKSLTDQGLTSHRLYPAKAQLYGTYPRRLVAILHLPEIKLSTLSTAPNIEANKLIKD